jgi:hypothetical protein
MHIYIKKKFNNTLNEITMGGGQVVFANAVSHMENTTNYVI